jgi:uncharacterized membrane protein YbhN (UPF0104 family)
MAAQVRPHIPDPNLASADLKRKLVRGGVLLAVVAGLAIGILLLVPGLHGVREEIAAASLGWVLVAAGLQLLGIAGAVVFVQLVYADEPHSLTWRMAAAQQAANAIVPTAGSTAVGYWTLSSVGWGVARFAERAAIMIVAPAAPNILLIAIVGVGMGLGVFVGPKEWWLTWLPAGLATLVAGVAIWASRWGHRLAARTRRRRLREALHVLATGVSGTVEMLRRRSWRVLGTWVDLLFAIGALWASLLAVGVHMQLSEVAMGYLLGALLQVIPVPGGIGAIDLGVTAGLVLYGADPTHAAAGEVIWHALALLVPIVTGSIVFALLPGEIDRVRRARVAPVVDSGGSPAGP